MADSTYPQHVCRLHVKLLLHCLLGKTLPMFLVTSVKALKFERVLVSEKRVRKVTQWLLLYKGSQAAKNPAGKWAKGRQPATQGRWRRGSQGAPMPRPPVPVAMDQTLPVSGAQKCVCSSDSTTACKAGGASCYFFFLKNRANCQCQQCCMKCYHFIETVLPSKNGTGNGLYCSVTQITRHKVAQVHNLQKKHPD